MMKSLFTLVLAFFIGAVTYSQGFQVTLQTPSYTSGLAYLTYHMGKNLNIEDSAIVSEKGVAIFKGEKPLSPGIYAIVFPGKRLTVDFFVDKEQKFTVKADTADFTKMQVIGGCKENEFFKAYQKVAAEKGTVMQKERLAYNASTSKEDSALHEANYNKLNDELSTYRKGVIAAQPNSMIAALFSAMKEPPYPPKKPVTRQDSVDNYNYYKSHYWDGITFMDDRIIRTPFFLPKLERYYREVMPQAPDSIIKDLDYKLLLARTAPEMYKFLLNWFTDEYINPRYMGQDAIFVHLFEKYHSKGVSSWLNEKQMQIITKRAYMQMSNLIGEKAANLEFLDTSGKPRPLYDVNADYVVVIFWDPTCGHCKQEVPKVDSAYKASWKAHNVKIYGVLSENQKTAWIKYINENKLGDWVNVYVTKEMEDADAAAQRPGFRQLYDVTMTPTLYLLDKDKRIIGKKLTWEQLNDLLVVKWKVDKNKP